VLLLSGTLHSVLTSVFLMLEKLPKEPIMAMGRAAAKPREDVVCGATGDLCLELGSGGGVLICKSVCNRGMEGAVTDGAQLVECMEQRGEFWSCRSKGHAGRGMHTPRGPLRTYAGRTGRQVRHTRAGTYGSTIKVLCVTLCAECLRLRCCNHCCCCCVAPPPPPR
jgi:hypothetical protein